MASIDPQTQTWINSLKLSKKISSISDFENGYNFGVILDKLQLSKGKKFKNSSDLACIFQNYKNVKDLLLQNFGYDFPVTNIMYRTEQLLKVLKQQCQKYSQKKKAATFNAATSVISANKTSLIQPIEDKMFKNRQKQITQTSYLNQTSRMPRKIQMIQQKLDKFRQQKTRHELFALQQRKQQLEQYRRVVMNNRDYQINKIRNLNALGREKQRKVYDIWSKTEQIKNNRILTDKQFQAFQQSKRDKLSQTLKQQQIDYVDKGLQMFHINCIRQGIQLQHDPDKPGKPEGDFNKVVVMERIKDNIKKHEKDKKQRIKRENKKRIQAEDAKMRSQQQWAQIHKIEDYQTKFISHFQLCQKTFKTQQRINAEKQIIKNRYANKKYIDLEPTDPQLQENRKQQLRSKKLQYMKNDLAILQNEWNQKISISSQIVEALLQVTVKGQQIFNKNQGLSYKQWKQIEQQFLKYDATISKSSKKSEYYLDYSNYNQNFFQYLQGSNSWKNYQLSDQSPIENQSSSQLVQAIDSLLNISYPNRQAPKVEPLPLHMPLKLIFGGQRLVGKSTFTARASERYSIPIINPEQLLKQAIDLAKPPTQQDPKKAGKNTKKEEPTAQKLELKQFGMNLFQHEKIQKFEDTKIEHFIAVIKFRLNQIFKTIQQKQQIQKYKQARQKQEERYNTAVKQFQQNQNKPKKDSKKGGNQVPDEPPKHNPIFYTQGFIIDDFPISESNIKALQRQMNSYICWDQSVNKDGQEIRQKISRILSLPKKVQNPRLVKGVFDLFFSLQSDDIESIKNRNKNRKIDPQTKIIYHPDYNPIPDVKGFGDKLVEMPVLDESIIESKNKEQWKKIERFYQKIGFQEQVATGVVQAPAYNIIVEEGAQEVNKTWAKIEERIQETMKKKYEWLQQKCRQYQKVKQNQAQDKQKQGTQQRKIDQAQKQNKQQGQNVQEQQKQNHKQQIQQHNQEENQKESQNQSGQLIQEQKIQLQNEKQLIPVKQLLSSKLTKQSSQQLVSKYLNIIQTYQSGIKESLYLLDNQRDNFASSLFNIQNNFTAIINRLDDRAGKILGFQQNYNKLLGQQATIVKDPQASAHLITRLDQLYDSLWTSIQAKKNEAVAERQKLMNSSWLNDQAEKIVEIGKKILQKQINYLCQTIFFIMTISCKILGKSSDVMTEYLSLGISPQLQPIFSCTPQSLTQNDRLEYYFNAANKCFDCLPNWIQQKYKKMKIYEQVPSQLKNLLNNFVQNWLKGISQKKNKIKNKINERVLQERSYFHALVNKMNQWIIQGIKSQNDFVYNIYKNMKSAIKQARRCTVKDLHVKQITQVFGPIKQLTLKPIPLRVYTHHRALPIFSYMIFLEEVKSLIVTLDGKINFETFRKYLEYRKKNQLLDKQILKIDFDTTSQYLVKDGYLFYRQLATAVLLWDVNVFDDDALARYQAKILGQRYAQNNVSDSIQEDKQIKQLNNEHKQETGSNQKNQQLNIGDNIQSYNNQQEKQTQIPIQKQSKDILKKKKSIVMNNPISKRISVQELILMQGAFDEEEQYIMKHFIFQIFRGKDNYVQVQTLLDTLCMFDQLQVLKYGDTVMMLGI